MKERIDTFFRNCGMGCQGFFGRFPSAFLDKLVKSKIMFYKISDSTSRTFSGISRSPGITKELLQRYSTIQSPAN
jgi:hypothetical protein